MTASIATRRRHASTAGRRGPSGQGIDADVKFNGEPEQWLVAARLSRVAKKDRLRGDAVINGIHTQDRRAVEWLQQQGHEHVDTTKDKNVSGAMPPWERPELGPWLTDPNLIVRYDGIVAYEVSRLSRDYADLAWLRKWAEQNHKKLYVIKERLHWPDNRDGVLWGVAAERAYEERQELIEKVTRELEALREAGKLVGRPPFGFTSEGEKYDRRLVPTPVGCKYIPLIFQHCKNGWSEEQIVDWLYSEGIVPQSGLWWPRTIGTIIKNPVYKGHRCAREYIRPDDVQEANGKIVMYLYGSTWVETPRWKYGKTIHRCEALVRAPAWQDANDALSTRPNRGFTDPGKRAMLSTALDCSQCDDSPMHKRQATDKGRTYYYYRCCGRGAHRQSCGNAVAQDCADQAVNEIFSRTFNIPVMREEIIYGNEAELEALLAENQFEREQLSKRGLPDDEEDAERARLRADRDGILSTKIVEDSVTLVQAGGTYRGLWEQLPIPERGPWLVMHGFRVTADKQNVTVTRGDVSGTLPVAKRERRPDAKPRLFAAGKCECGCGADLVASQYSRKKKYISTAHSQVAYRQRLTERAGIA